MQKKNSFFKNIFNKIAAKRFSKQEIIIIIVIFAIALIFAYYHLSKWTKSFKSLKVIAPITPPEKPGRVQKVKSKEEKTKEPSGSAKSFNIRDPFLASKNTDSVIIEKNPILNMKLKGVLWDDQIPTAIINSRVVKIGDLIDNKTVVDIEKDKVILMEDGEVYLLKLRNTR